MTSQTGLLAFGALLLLIAIVGGGFEVKEIKIPQVGKIPRAVAAIGGIVFIVMSSGYPDNSAKTAPVAVPQKPRQAGDSILGTWKQYSYDQTSQKWEYLGTFDVAKVNGSYIISAREQRESSGIMNTIGIFDVQSDGKSWTFNSNWGHGAVGNFSMHRISETVFEGDVAVEGRPAGSTKFVRIQ
jgi:hypothetical protein